MSNTLSRIRKSLTRKLGPLPVWAWALIAGAAIYVYRVRSGTAGAGAAAGTSAPDLQAPVTLQPGESVYDPNTGALVGAPGGSSTGGDQGAITPTPANPLVPLAPGQSYYDPNTGETVSGPDVAQATTKKQAGNQHHANPKSPLARAKARVALGRGGKRTFGILQRAGFTRGQITHALRTHSHLGRPKNVPKPRPKHPRTVKKPGHGKTRARASATVANAVHSVSSRTGGATGRVRGTASSPAAARGRTHSASARTPAMRQRPAAPRITHPATQKVQTHPARQAPKPPPKRRRKK